MFMKIGVKRTTSLVIFVTMFFCDKGYISIIIILTSMANNITVLQKQMRNLANVKFKKNYRLWLLQGIKLCSLSQNTKYTVTLNCLIECSLAVIYYIFKM